MCRSPYYPCNVILRWGIYFTSQIIAVVNQPHSWCVLWSREHLPELPSVPVFTAAGVNWELYSRGIRIQGECAPPCCSNLKWRADFPPETTALLQPCCCALQVGKILNFDHATKQIDLELQDAWQGRGHVQYRCKVLNVMSLRGIHSIFLHKCATHLSFSPSRAWKVWPGLSEPRRLRESGVCCFQRLSGKPQYRATTW